MKTVATSFRVGIEWTVVFRMALLFLALVPSGHAKKEKTRLQEHVIIYVMKTEMMTVEKIIQKSKKKKANERGTLFS